MTNMAYQIILWLLFLTHVTPCDTQTDFTIQRFIFAEDDYVTFIIQQPKTFNILLYIEVSTTKTVTKTFETKFYLNNTAGAQFEQQLLNRQETSVPDHKGKAQLQLFRVREEDELMVTLPKNANCDLQYTYCVEVRDIKSEKWSAACVSNFNVSCVQPMIGGSLPGDFLPDFFLPVIIAAAAIVIFIILVCCVLIRFRKRIAQSRRWHVISRSPEEAYNVIRKRLAVKSFYDNKPYTLDPKTNKPVVISDTDSYSNSKDLEMKEDPDAEGYSHLQRLKINPSTGNGGTDNPAFVQTTPEIHPYEDNLPGDKHPYEDELPDKHPYQDTLKSHPYEEEINPYDNNFKGTSHGRLSSSSQIQVAVENEINQRKDSGTSRQTSSSEPDSQQLGSSDSYEPFGSGSSYIPAFPSSSRNSRDRSESINPLKPDVDLERLSRSGSSEPRSSIDFLDDPPPIPNAGNSNDKQEPEPPPLLHPRPSTKAKPSIKPKPSKKPKNVPPKPLPRLSRSGEEVIKQPEVKIKDRNKQPYKSHFTVTDGGSTRTPADFRRPSLFRTLSNEMLFTNPNQKKPLPEIIQLALEGGHGPLPKISSTGTLKRSQAQFARAALENFQALVDEIEHPEENDDEATRIPEIPVADSSYEQARIGERPYKRPLSVRRNSTPLLLDTSNKRQSSMSVKSEDSYASYTSDIYVNKWNKEWEFDRDNLNVDRGKALGEGQFGLVYQGMARNIAGRPGGTMVAIKELKDGARTEDKDEFLKELAIHTLIEPHENVIELLGCCIRDEPLCIIIEFMENGSLLRYLRKQNRNEALAQYLTVRFGYQCALGMMHVADMGIVHRDLAARNILVSDQLLCKVSDFGFARDVFGVNSYNKAPEKAPIRWYAPEAILDDKFTTKTDVWSFGILLFEMITMGYVLPYHRDPSTASVRLTIMTGGVPPQPPYCNDELYAIMKLCWQRDPEKRPEFEELAAILNDLQDKYEPPSPYGESDA